MGVEDGVEQSFGRPCRLTNGRFKRPSKLTSSIVPRGTSFHRRALESIRWVSLGYLLAFASFLPIFGQLCEIFGRKLLYLTGFERRVVRYM